MNLQYYSPNSGAVLALFVNKLAEANLLGTNSPRTNYTRGIYGPADAERDK